MSKTTTPVMTQREIRKALYRNGHIPTPVSGKRPILNDWPRLAVDERVIDDWGEAGNGTGAVCSRTAGFDLDILDEGAVRIVLAEGARSGIYPATVQENYQEVQGPRRQHS
jgi:hypothetical protein